VVDGEPSGDRDPHHSGNENARPDALLNGAKGGFIKTVTLYRPVGPAELDLIRKSDWKTFPPRLPGQPIFYPVMNFEYAAEIAEKWNAAGSEKAGFVLRFEVEADYVAKFEEHTVGAKRHRELWVPAEELPEFNRHIVGKIVVEATFSGDM
jgi:hypothetical protein